MEEGAFEDKTNFRDIFFKLLLKKKISLLSLTTFLYPGKTALRLVLTSSKAAFGLLSHSEMIER